MKYMGFKIEEGAYRWWYITNPNGVSMGYAKTLNEAKELVRRMI